MKTEILNSQEITKDIALTELSNINLSKDEVDEYLDIITAINDNQKVFNVTTNKGKYLLYIKEDTIKNTKNKIK